MPDRTLAAHRVDVARLDVAHLRAHVAGREDVGEEEHLLVGHAVRDLDGPDVGERHARELGLPARVAAQHVRVAEDARRRVAPHLLGHPRVGVRVLAQREELLRAHVAGATRDRERHDHAVADLEVLHRGPDLDDLAHELVAQDVALLHRRHEAVVEVEIRAADRGRGDADDGVAGVQDLGIRDLLDPDISLTHPAVGIHRISSFCVS
jgi:hypothetical protein